MRVQVSFAALPRRVDAERFFVCPRCGGSGWLTGPWAGPCNACDGTGTLARGRTYTYEVPDAILSMLPGPLAVGSVVVVGTDRGPQRVTVVRLDSAYGGDVQSILQVVAL